MLSAMPSIASHWAPRASRSGNLLACSPNDETLALAIEELEAEFRLERLYLVAHSPLSDEQLLGSAREALVSRRGPRKLSVH
jgi:hypothetical protein